MGIALISVVSPNVCWPLLVGQMVCARFNNYLLCFVDFVVQPKWFVLDAVKVQNMYKKSTPSSSKKVVK